MYTITVTNLNDSGTGSLREAIAFANSYTGIDEIQIVFDESLTGKTIYLESDLPVVSTDCAIIGNGVSWSEYPLSTTASVELTDLEFPQLILTGIASVSSQNVILTSQDAIRLEAWSSGGADFSGIVTTADNAYAVVDSWVGDLNNLVLPELPECMDGGYRINVPVTNLNDEGAGSLREAIAFANSYTGIDEIQIVFDESLTGKTIYLESDLPVVSTDCAIIGNGVSWSEYPLSTTASVELTDLEFPQLILTGIASVSSQNVILTSQDAIRLEAWSSGGADFSGIVTTADNAYAVVDSWVGDLNNLVLPELPECMDGGYRINVPVTNLNDEGAGSLRAAILLANSYIGEGEIHIIIDELLAGQSMSLTYELPTITRPCHIEAPAEGISISSGLYIGAETYLRNLSASQVVLTASGSLKAENVTLTARAAIRLVDWGGETDFSGIRATAQNAYVLLHGNLYDATLTTLPESFAGGYQCGDYYNGDSLYIAQGSTVTLEDGVAVKITASYGLYVSGTLKAEYEESASAIFSNSSYDTGCLYVENGGKVLLTNANIKDVDVYVRDGSFQMNGGSFEGYNHEMWGERAGRLTIDSSSMATLSNVEVSVPIINDGGYLEMDNINSTSSIEINGESLLDDVTCTQLIVNDGSVTTSEGKKVYLASYTPFVFGNAFDGAISDFLSSFDWEITSTQARVYLRQCDLGKVVLSELPEQLSSGYVGSVVLSEGETANLNDKDMKSVDVENNGTLTLSRCQTNNVSNNGSLTLEDVSVSGYVISKGTLVMEGSEVSSYIRLHGNALLDGVSCTQLRVYNGSRVSSGEKGVTLTLEDAFTIAPDFVGNIGEWLNSFKWSVTSDEACVYLNGCDLSKLALTRLPEPLKGGYDGYVYVYDDDELQLSNQFWTCRVYNYGKLVVKDAEIGQVANGGMLELENVKVDGHITSRISKWDDLNYVYTTYFGKLNLKNVVISDYVGVAEEACLDNVVCSYLEVGDSSAVCIGEHGIRLTGGTLYSSGEGETWPLAEDVAFVLTSSFEGDIAEWLNSFEWEVDNADAGIYLSNCDLSKVTLSTLPESLSGGYHGSVTVPAGKEISLYDIESSSLYINNDGSLTLEKSIIHSVDNSCYVSMIGGKIARNHSENEYISGAGNVSNSGTMTLWDVSVEAYSVSNSGTMTLENVSVEAYTISNSGTMSITDCDVDTRNIYLYNNSELFAENVVFGDVSVDIYSSSTRIVGSDLSRASIMIMGTPGDESLIDLSGNYWGTTDLTEIWAKIDGDKSRVVIDDIMLASPPRVFTLTKVSTDWLKIADTAGQLTLNFNREVDAGSVSMESLGLCREDGSVVSIKEYIVEGKSVTLIFDTLSIGQYFLQVTNDLKDANGNAFSMPSGFESGISYEVYDSSANVPPRLLLVIPNSTLMEKFSYVDLFFNQAMDTDSMTVDKVHVFSSSGEEIKVTSCYKTETSGRTCYRMEFDAVTEQGLYTLSVDSSVCNMFGVEMSASFEQQIYVGNPDIQPTDEISITSSALGRNTVITYTVKNESKTEAIGPWMDSFYLCKTPQWNADEAVLLGRVLHEGSLPADGGIESTMNTLMQGIVPGDYYLFVRTDESDRVNEFDEENNLSAIGTHIRVWADELKLGAHTVEKLDSLNEWYVYQYTAERNETLKLGIDCENATIAIRDSAGNVLSDTPNRSSAGRSVCYFETNAGETYTIQVKGKELREHQMELKEVPLSLWSASSVKLVAGVKNSVVLSGCCFESDMQVYLQDEDGNRYDAASVQVDSSFQARVELELPETLEIGSKLTLHVGSGESEVAQLDTPLVISTYANMTLKFENMDGESHTNRVGWVWRAHLLADNETAGDVRNAIILVTDSAEDFAMFYNYEEANTRDRSGLLFLAGEDAQTPGILHNGERAKMDIFVRNYRSGTGEIRAFVLDPTDESEIAPRRWEQLGSALRPVSVNDADWAAWWGNMQPRIGTTVSDFANFIYEMQGLVAMDGGKRSQCLPDLVAQVMENHPEYKPSFALSGTLRGNYSGEVQKNQLVSLYEERDGEMVCIGTTETDENGYYVFYGVKDGRNYSLSANSFWDNNQDFIIDSTNPQVTVLGEDAVFNGYVDDSPTPTGLASNTGYRYASDEQGRAYRLWSQNGVTVFGQCVDGKWETYSLYDDYNPSVSLFWSSSLNCLVVARKEADGSLSVRYGIRNQEGELQWSDNNTLKLTLPDSDEFNLLDMEDGRVCVLGIQQANGEERPGLFDIATAEILGQQTWNKMSPDDSVTETLTGDSTTYKWGFEPSRFAFLEKLGFYGSVSGSLNATVNSGSESGSADFGGTLTYSNMNLRGYNTDKLTFTVTAEGGIDAVCEDNESKITNNLSVSFGFDIYRRQGLISLLGLIPPLRPAMKGLEVLNRFVKKFGFILHAGWGVKTNISWSSSNGDIIHPSWTPYVKIGVEQTKLKSDLLSGGFECTATGGIEGSFDFNIQTLGISNLQGNPDVTLSIHTPTLKGVGSFSYEGSFMDLVTGRKQFCFNEDDSEVDTNSKWYTPWATGRFFFNLGRDGYAIYSEYGERMTTGSLSCAADSKLYGAENSRITNQQVESAGGDWLCLKAEGLTELPTDIQQSGTLEYYDNLLNSYMPKQTVETVLLNVRTQESKLVNQESFMCPITPQSLTAGVDGEQTAPASEIVNLGENVVASRIFAHNDRLYMGWVTKVEDTYLMALSELDGDAWSTPTIIHQTMDELWDCSLFTENGQLQFTAQYTHSYENGSTEDGVIRFVENQSRWEQIDDNVESSIVETSGIVEDLFDGVSSLMTVIQAMTSQMDCDDPDDELPHEDFQSFDPNDIYGPEGYGAQKWIGRKEMRFEVVCENIPEENIAHAAMVTIKQQIDAAYDYSTFRLGDMMIAGNYIEVTGDVQHFQERVDWTETLGVLVDVNAFFDADTGEVTWEFVAIDPETGWVVGDPFMGLLAPNYNPPEGDGGVTYYVTPKETAESGTVMQAEAEIIFDFNEPIDTPLIKYTLDVDNPLATVESVAEAGTAGYLLVRWSGSDVGSGIKAYDVYVSVDGGEWQLWQDDISFDRALYAKLVGEHSYAFYAVAMDYAGNDEAVTEVVSAESSLVSTHTDAESSLTVNSVQAVRAGDELTLSIAFSEQAVCADWAAALLVSTSAQNIDLSAGTFRYDDTTHVLTWVGTVAGVPDGAQATVRLTDGEVTDAMGLPFGSSAPAYTAPIELAGVVGSTYAAPALVDYNGDGLLDVLVGEVAENGKGRIRIYLNEGSAEVASFASFIYASTAEDTPIELAATGCQGAIVRLADITGDGKNEMVVGLADGTIRIFTAAEGGYWTDSGELSCAVGGESETVDVGTRAAIEFVDANGDGRTDLLVGTGDGNVLLYLNTSAEGAAAFDAGRYLHDAAGRIDVGSRATVATGDFDGDGLWDMLLGTADGTVLFYRNEGTTGTPLFGAAETVFAGDAPLDMSSETNRVRIDTGDLDGDGIDDLVVGWSDGSVKVLYGEDSADLIGAVVVGSIPLPKAPQNVQLTVNGGRVQISWSAVEMDESSAISYEISYCIEGSDTPEVLVVNETAHTLELADAVYSVQVRALNHGKGGDWSPAQRVMVDTIAPAVPAGMQAVGGETVAALSWNAVADAVSYEFRYRQAGSQVWRTVSSSITNASLESLSPAAYEWQVRATDAAGNASAWSASGSFAVTGVVPDTEQHWASGILFDASGAVTGGYFDVNKTGAADNNLCWAAAAANILAWWQEQGLTTTLVPEAPQGAAAIYSTFTQNWENASGAEAYAFIWWLSGDSTSQTYANYVNAHYCGDSSTGAYYKQFYTAQTISRHMAQVSLSGVGAAELSGTWAGIYGASGMIALGIFHSISSGGQLNGGHSLTLWGFESDKESGEITEIYVTDSDDSATTLRTLAVDYDAQTGYYTISQADSNFKGYVLGNYTWLNAFSGVDIVVPKVTLSAPVVEKLAEGRIRVTLSWSASESATYVLTVDGKDYALGSATSHTLELADGEHSYSVKATDAAGNVGTAGSSFAMDATAPETVQSVIATTGKAGVSVTWTAMADAATYTLQYATKADFSDAKTVEGITDTAHTLTGLPGTGTLYVRVSAADAAGNESGWSASAQTGLDITAPVVTLKTPEMEKVGEGRIRVTLSWSSSESAVYTLTVDGVDYAMETAMTHTLELADGEHSYSVKATDAAGNVGTAGSSFAMDATAPETVQSVIATTGKAGVSVTWTAMADAATYTLQYATKADFSDAKTVEGITDTAHTLTGLPGTGTLYVRVSAADAAGNESGWSAPAQTGLDITAPDAVQGLVSLAHGTSVRLNWAAANDVSGISGYRLQYAVNGDFSKAYTIQVNGLETIFYTLQSNTTFQWRVAAVDGVGNIGAWSAVASFRTGAAEPADDSVSESHEIEMSLPAGGESHSSSPVSGWVGFDDPTDFYSFTAKGAGAYAVHLDSAIQGTQVFLSVGTLDAEGNFAAAQKLVVAPGSASSALGGIVLEKGEQCFIRVDSYDKGLGRYNGEYTLSVEAEVPETDILTDNNTLEKATVLAESSAADARLNGWVGAGDAVDYYRFQLQDAAELTLVLDELESSVRVKLLHEQNDGRLSQVLNRSVKSASGLDRTLSLTSGAYFVEISSYDNGAGRHNSTYALELEKEEDGEVKRYAIAGSGL